MAMSKSKNDEMASTDSYQALSLFFALIVGELSLSRKDASQTFSGLTNIFMDMVQDVHEMKACLDRHSGEKSAELQQAEKVYHQFLDKVSEGTRRFQFYDKLTQRLQHTTESLQNAAEFCGEETGFHKTELWQQLRDNMRSRYNTEQDRSLYELLMKGESIKKAVETAMSNKDNGKDIELF